LDGK